MLIVDREARTIRGRVVPYDTTASVALRLPRRFPRGSLTWISWPPLLIEHDRSLRAGVTCALGHATDGLWATLKVRKTPLGDRALALAALPQTGLSFEPSDVVSRITDDGIWECVSARIAEITLTRNPVFS